MQRSESRRGGGGGGGDGSGPSPGFDAFSYNPSQWARAGRVARELFAEAGEHLKVSGRVGWFHMVWGSVVLQGITISMHHQQSA